MKKSLAILLSICLVLTTIYGCFVISASAEAVTEPTTNLWDVAGAPDQSGMSYWGDGNFAGEENGNANYILGESNGKVSPYGWRAVGLAANANQRVGRYDGNYVHGDSPAALECGLMVQLKYAQRGVSRQIQLEAGKAYTLSFWFKGTITGFDVQALSAITNNHESGGTSIITAKTHDINTKSQSFSDITGSTWVYVTVNFTMPNDKSVANIILANGNVNDTDAAFDDFLLYRNYWNAGYGTPDQSIFGAYNADFFSGEFSSGTWNKNYILGQNDNGTPKATQNSPYGWRGYGLQAEDGHCAARYDWGASPRSYCYYPESGPTGFKFRFKSTYTGKLSRQIQVEAGKSYTLQFWFKGTIKGFDIQALSSIVGTHQNTGESIVTSTTHNINNASAATYSTSLSTTDPLADTWADVKYTFTMPSDKSVVNVVFGEGSDFDCAFDDFKLYESEAVIPPAVVINYWAVEGAPDQCTMSYWGDGNFAGETGGNANYILGESSGKVSPYGWRGTSLAANANQRAGRLSDSAGVYYHHNPTQALDCAFVVQLVSSDVRGVSRQIQLTAGKSYTFNFYFKGVVQGFDITALSAIQNTHQSAVGGDSIITAMDYDLSATGQSFSDVTADTWAYVTVNFTMPSDKSVANFILGEGKACHAAYDDFSLVESEAVVGISTDIDYTNISKPYPSFTCGNTATASSASAAEGGTVTLTATPASGFSFDGWYLGGSKVSSSASYTATVGTDGNYVAKFVAPEEINYWADGDMESISPKYSYLGSNIVNGENEDGWITLRTSNYSPVRAVADTTESYNSSTSLKLDFSGAVRALGKRLKLTNGKTYAITFHYKGGGNGFGVYNHNSINTTLLCNDVDNGLRAMSTENDGPAKELVYDTPRGSSWAEYTYIFTLDSGDYVDIVWTSASAAWIDDVTLVETAPLATVNTDIDFVGLTKPYAAFTGGNAASTSNSSVTVGSTVTLTATTSTGYTFDGWYVDDSKVSSSESYNPTIEANTTFVAKFAPTSDTNYWDDGDMETISSKYTYLGSNITNGSNEDGWITLRTGNYSPARAVVDNTESYNSSTSLKLDFSGAVRALGKRLKLTNGNTYTLTFYYKGGGNGFGVYNHNSISTVLDFSDKDNGLRDMSTQNGGPAKELVYATPRGSDWTQYTYTFTLNSGDYVDIVWTATNAAWIDDVVLTASSTHVHEWGDLVPETELTCASDGHYAYYYCAGCGCYKDADDNIVPWSEISKGERPAHSFVYHAGVAATCTTDGTEEYKVCTSCNQLFDMEGNVISAVKTIPKYHSVEGARVHAAQLPSYEEDGNVVYYECTAPGCVNGDAKYSLTPDFETVYTHTQIVNEAKLPALQDDGEKPVEYGGLTLNGEIGFNFFFDNIEAYQDAYGIEEATLKIFGVDAFDEYGNLKGDAVPVATLDGQFDFDHNAGEGAFVNYYSPEGLVTVRADQMNKPIAIVLYDTSSGEDEIVTDFHDNGVYEITAMDILKMYVDIYQNDSQAGAQEIVQLSRACITYGGYAISYFEKTDYEDPGDAYGLDISTVTQTVVDAIPGQSKSGAATDFSIIAATFLVEAKSAVRFYYSLDNDADISNYTVTATIGGNAVDSSNIILSQNSLGQAYIQIANIGASDLSKALVIRVSNNADSSVMQASYNALCYAKNQINNENSSDYLKDLCKAIILYSNAGDAYAAVA